MTHLDKQQLESGLDEIRRSPKDNGVLHLIVRRPKTDLREVLDEGELDVTNGLLGDNWLARGNRRTADGKSNPEMQLNGHHDYRSWRHTAGRQCHAGGRL